MSKIHFPNSPPLSRSALTNVVAPFGADAVARVRRAIGACPVHAVTPLHRLTELAHTWGLKEIWVKDERARLGLRSFKALGGAYAVLRLSAAVASRGAGRAVSIATLLHSGAPALADTTFAAATSGNHGCSVAAGARLVGARCVVFVRGDIAPDLRRAISDQGAQIVAVPGSYDDATAACRLACARNGWICVADSALEPGDAAVALVMEGYTVIGAELLDALPRIPSHVIVQAGVGGFAAAVAGHIAAVTDARRPSVIVAEPDAAACLQASALAGHPVVVPRTSSTSMARLECYSPSRAAWPALSAIASAYASVSDAAAAAACLLLGRHGLHTTPSGAAGLAALEQLIASPDACQRLSLGADSEAVVFVTEAPSTADGASNSLEQ